MFLAFILLKQNNKKKKAAVHTIHNSFLRSEQCTLKLLLIGSLCLFVHILNDLRGLCAGDEFAETR